MEKVVDIIIPAYNSHDTIMKSLSSIVCQSILDGILITIVDDCSEEPYDYLLERFKGVADIQLIRMSRNSGPGVCRQVGIDNTSCPYIVFVDSDDQIASQHSVENLYNSINDNDFDIVISDFFEDIGNSKFLQHQQDFTWVFSKIYRRAFLEENEIRFSDVFSYANEDSGFNTLANMLVDDNKLGIGNYITYTWSGRKESTTRSNFNEYSYNQGFSGFIDNQIYALNNLFSRPSLKNPDKIKCQITSVFLNCYKTMVECYYSLHHSDRQVFILDRTRDFYFRYKPILDNMLSSGFFIAQYPKVMSQPLVLPFTIYDFIHLVDDQKDIDGLRKDHIIATSSNS